MVSWQCCNATVSFFNINRRLVKTKSALKAGCYAHRRMTTVMKIGVRVLHSDDKWDNDTEIGRGCS